MDLCRGLLFSWPLPWSVSHKNHFHAALVLKTLCYSLQMRNQIHLLHSRECRPLNKSLLSTCSVLGMEPAPPPGGRSGTRQPPSQSHMRIEGRRAQEKQEATRVAHGVLETVTWCPDSQSGTIQWGLRV